MSSTIGKIKELSIWILRDISQTVLLQTYGGTKQDGQCSFYVSTTLVLNYLVQST